MLLPGPKRDYSLSLNLRLAEAMEQEGSLVSLAERLTAGDLRPEEAFARLKTPYHAAGCLLPQESLKRFLEGRDMQALLAAVLLHILSPLLDMGAVLPGKPLPAQAGR